jgi:hypothetical protein
MAAVTQRQKKCQSTIAYNGEDKCSRPDPQSNDEPSEDEEEPMYAIYSMFSVEVFA